MYNLRTVEVLKYAAMAFASAMFGAQIVHNAYNPMGDIEDLVQIELEKLRQEARK